MEKDRYEYDIIISNQRHIKNITKIYKVFGKKDEALPHLNGKARLGER